MKQLFSSSEIISRGGYQPIPTPEPAEVGEYVPDKFELEKMEAARLKRERKTNLKLVHSRPTHVNSNQKNRKKKFVNF